MNRLALTFTHKASYTSVDDVFADWTAEAQKLTPILAVLGYELYVNSTDYAIGYKDSNGNIKYFIGMYRNDGSNSFSIDNKDYAPTYTRSGTINAYNTYTPITLSTDTEYIIWTSPFFTFGSSSYYTGSATIKALDGNIISSSAYRNFTIGSETNRIYGIPLIFIFYYNNNSVFVHKYQDSSNTVYNKYSMALKQNGKVYCFSDITAANSYAVYDETEYTQRTYQTTHNNDENSASNTATLLTIQVAEATDLENAYVGTIPAPNGRYNINNTPYFCYNGMCVKDE